MPLSVSKTVIVPWDFSKQCVASLEKALEIAESPEQIQLIHVTPYPVSIDSGMVWGSFSEDDIRHNLNESFKNSETGKRYPDLNFQAFFGDPGTEIARHAEDVGAELIVIASHGRQGLNRLLLGSVAERVVRLAPCPVMVLRGGTGN